MTPTATSYTRAETLLRERRDKDLGRRVWDLGFSAINGLRRVIWGDGKENANYYFGFRVSGRNGKWNRTWNME